MRKLFLFIFTASLLFPNISLAGSYTDAGGNVINYSGLVPCGKTPGPEESWQVETPCQFCHFFVMGKGILDFVLELVIIVAVGMFVYGGFLYLTGGGNPGQMQTAQKVLTSTVIGLIIIFAAWVLVNTVFLFLGLSDFALQFTGPDKWFKIFCPITIPPL